LIIAHILIVMETTYLSPKKITSIIGPDGLLKNYIPNYEYRPNQAKMAEALKYYLDENKHIVVEGETGLGKTLAYLLAVSQSNKQVIISTYTKNLQDQILRNDLPLLEQCLERKINAIIVKGRSNYICMRRFIEASERGRISKEIIQRISSWLSETKTGDLDEITDFNLSYEIKEAIQSDREFCSQKECQASSGCFHSRLRKKLSYYDFIIVNHHLYFADLVQSRSFLPAADITVFDEAHCLETVATDCLSIRMEHSKITKLIQQVKRDYEESMNFTNIMLMANDIVQSSRNLFDALRQDRAKRYRLDKRPGIKKSINSSYGYIRNGFFDLRRLLEGERINRKNLVYLDKIMQMEFELETIFENKNNNHLIWINMNDKGASISATPIDLADELRNLEFLYGQMIFTSATLSEKENFEYFKKPLGILNSIELQFDSHFNFKDNTCFYIPRNIAEPKQRYSSEWEKRKNDLKKHILDIINITRGRALILFTNLENMRELYREIKSIAPYKVLLQGDAPKADLIRQFKEDVHSILFASNSFWQGVDIPGEALSCVIIDKIPFPVPNDPIVESRRDLIERRGGNPFSEYLLPTAVIFLKQGFGRLLRKKTDKGLICLLDSRIYNRGYGKQILNELEKFRPSDDIQTVSYFFNHHA